MPLRDGPVDVHAHILPEPCFAEIGLRDAEGELHLGDLPLSIVPRTLADPAQVLDDMDRYGIAVRALSPPPFVFHRSAAYTATVNDAVAGACETDPDRLVGLGAVPTGSADEAVEEIQRVADMGIMRGLTMPPLVGDGSLDVDPLRAAVTEAHRLGLCMVVHPMQLPGPGLGHHYLTNLLGNPTESAAAIGAVVLSGMGEAMPDLRIAFFHGGGCAPYLLGRWDHGWSARPDVRADTDQRPSDTFRQLYIDTLTHGVGPARYLAEVSGADRLVLGSDYPFDMAAEDPVGAARAAGLDLDALTANARRFLGV